MKQASILYWKHIESLWWCYENLIGDRDVHSAKIKLVGCPVGKYWVFLWALSEGGINAGDWFKSNSGYLDRWFFKLCKKRSINSGKFNPYLHFYLNFITFEIKQDSKLEAKVKKIINIDKKFSVSTLFWIKN